MSYFLALLDLGAAEAERCLAASHPEVPFCTLPLDTKAKRSKKVIRLILDTGTGISGDIPLITGISGADVTDYMPDAECAGFSGDERTGFWRRRYLFREFPGAGTPYSPGFRLGVPAAAPEIRIRRLLPVPSEKFDSRTGGAIALLARYFADAEAAGAVAPGSCGTILSLSAEAASVIGDLWLSRDANYFLTVCLKAPGTVLYPGDVPSLVKYFMDRIDGDLVDVGDLPCSLCGSTIGRSGLLSDVFPFATASKKNFLPGLPSCSEGARERAAATAFPVCRDCLGKLSLGRAVSEDQLSIFGLGANLTLTVVPEAIGGASPFLSEAVRILSRRSGTSRTSGMETRLSRMAEKRGGRLNFHMLLTERIKGEQRIHALIEDVSPSSIRTVERIWSETCLALGNTRTGNLPMESILQRVALEIMSSPLAVEEGQARADVAKRCALRTARSILTGRGSGMDTDGVKRVFLQRVEQHFRTPPGSNDLALYMSNCVLVTSFMERFRNEPEQPCPEMGSLYEALRDPCLMTVEGRLAVMAGVVAGWTAARQGKTLERPPRLTSVGWSILVGHASARSVARSLRIASVIGSREWPREIKVARRSAAAALSRFRAAGNGNFSEAANFIYVDAFLRHEFYLGKIFGQDAAPKNAFEAILAEPDPDPKEEVEEIAIAVGAAG